VNPGLLAAPALHQIRFAGALVACLLALAPGVTAAEPPAIRYVYDELNRLVAVVDQHGDAATYSYDAVGNILRIDRFDVSELAGEVGISLVAPTQGPAGTDVLIFGKGFGAGTADSAVAFNGVPATVTQAAPNRLVVTVPSGATTGFITVSSPRGTGRSPAPFVVLGPVALAPTAAVVIANGRLQFTATQDGVPAGVQWAVNGIPGGQASIGTIGDDGVYRAPAAAAEPTVVEVSATHIHYRALAATAAVTFLPPIPVALQAAVSVAPASPPLVVDKSVTASVSIGVAPVIDGSLIASVSVGVAPVIVSVTPAMVDRDTSISVAIAGRGLSGATDLVFLRNNAPDSTITVTDLVVSADGTEATAGVRIDAGAPPGDRVVHIVTPTGSSTRVGTGGNVQGVR
jgi:YD repeat-containing protein